MTSRASLHAIALVISTALLAEANATCRIGAALDGKSYRLCEYRNEVLVEELPGNRAAYDTGINVLVSHSRDLRVRSEHQAIPFTSYIGTVGTVDLPQANGVVGFTLGAKLAEHWRAEVSVYPLAFRNGGGGFSPSSPAYNKIAASAFLGYTLANLGSTSFYVGSEFAIAQVRSHNHMNFIGYPNRKSALFGIAVGISQEITRNISLDISYRSYLSFEGGQSPQALRFALNYSL